MGELKEELNWIEKNGRLGVAKGADVLVSVSKKHGNGVGKLYLNFYRGVEKRVSDTGFIVVAIRDNRIYMKSSNMADGYTLAKSGTKGTTKIAQITIPEEDYFMIKRKVGSYILFKDNQLGLYYIELTEKK